jgi:hypothetical protein
LGGANQGEADAFLAKYDSSGDLLWNRQIGSAVSDRGFEVTADALGNVFIVGSTRGSLVSGNDNGHSEAFIAKYDAGGNFAWSKQLGTNQGDVGMTASVDGLGNVYVAGYTQVAPPRQHDAILRKYDSTGALLWTRQLGTSVTDVAYAVSADRTGGIYLTGSTNGNLAGANLGGDDLFLASYDEDGDLRWLRQFGSPELDAAWSVVSDGRGSVYVSGWTRGAFGELSSGGLDALLVKVAIPEPGGAWLVLAGLGTLLCSWRAGGLQLSPR